MRLPSVRVTELSFAAGTPLRDGARDATEDGSSRCLRPEVARALRVALLDVVANGTARRANGASHEPLGGKTGTGDHQRSASTRGANDDSEYVSRPPHSYSSRATASTA